MNKVKEGGRPGALASPQTVACNAFFDMSWTDRATPAVQPVDSASRQLALISPLRLTSSLSTDCW